MPGNLADRFALGLTRRLRFFAGTIFAKRCGHRAIVLETIAAVPGTMGAMATHLSTTRSPTSSPVCRPIPRQSPPTPSMRISPAEPCAAC